MYTVLALLHPMASALGTTPGQATWTATAFGFAYAAGFLLSGSLSDRYGPRAVITAALVAAAASTAAVSAAPNLPTAIALRSLQGLTAATFAPSALTYVVHHIGPRLCPHLHHQRHARRRHHADPRPSRPSSAGARSSGSVPP
ncbi:MFS transporter [Streptomyces sp. CA-251387]|uniref:MFS transporter n=1 Tax=Streptomyces sp. CA-251387 TaxID=3240064 RepID=UPI003D8C28F3